MRSFLGLIFGGAVAIAVGCGVAVAVQRMLPYVFGPRLLLSENVVEFAQPASGQDEAAYVTLTNAGRSTLLISQVDVSCGCTSAKLETAKVPPGATSRLRITATGSKLGIPQLNTVSVASNDPRRPKLQIAVVIRPAKVLGFIPGEVDFGRIESSRLPVTELLSLQLEEGFPSKQEGTVIDSNLAHVTCEIVSWDAANNSLSALLTMDRSAPAGEIAGRVAIRLPGSDREHSARISGCVVGDYFAEPPAIVRGPILKGDSATSHVIRIQPRSGDPANFKITGTTRGPEWPAEGLSASIVEGTGNPEIRLTCDPARWSEPWSTRGLRTSVRVSIRSSEGKASELNVPVELVLEN